MQTNWPNILTYARIAMVPAIVAVLMLDSFTGRWLALAIFILAGITDFFDGYLARAWQQQSNLGRMLDPIADKLLVAAVILALVADGTIAGWEIWAGLIILCREILVSGLREFLAEVKVSVPVTALAKWKTTIQMIALGVLLAGPAGDALVPGVTATGTVLLWIAAVLTLYTGYDYFNSGLRHVVADDAETPAPDGTERGA